MKKIIVVLLTLFLFSGCTENPITGKKTMAFVDNSYLFPQSFAEYETFINNNEVIEGTAEAKMVKRAGERLSKAAQLWLEREGYGGYLNDYEWDYNLVHDDNINAWCMPGGKIVVYSGILPVAQTEEGLAVVMGHEIAHALLNHGQQRVSAGILKTIGSILLNILTLGQGDLVRQVVLIGYDMGSEVLGTLPFSREHEIEADRYGLILMSIAGYNPEEAAPFWERMSEKTGGSSKEEFFSTHPADEKRIRNLREWTEEAKKIAESFGVKF
jgi:predicted Zn-dependent protease